MLDSFEADEEIAPSSLPGTRRPLRLVPTSPEMRSMSFVGCARQRLHRQVESHHRLPQPVVAAVAGYALGGGCELAMCATSRLRRRQREIRPAGNQARRHSGAGGTHASPAAVGKSKAMEMILTRAHDECRGGRRSGLVSRVVPVADVVDEAITVAKRIAHFSRAHRRARQGKRQPRLRDPRWPRACCTSARSSSEFRPPRIRGKVWTPSSKSASRPSPIVSRTRTGRPARSGPMAPLTPPAGVV